MNDASHPADAPSAKPLPITRMFAKTCYGFFIAGCFLPPLLLIALTLNLLRRGHAKGTWLESHFRRQLNAFLLTLAMLALVVLALVSLSGSAYLLGAMVGAGALTSQSAEAFILLPIAAVLLPVVFFLVRMASGLSALNRNEAI